MNTVYADDYGIIDCQYIVHACMVDPEPEHGHSDWLIGLLLHVGQNAHHCALTYPNRALRDGAMEAIVGLVKRYAARQSLEYVDDDEEEA